jgi:hypothetical protein
LGVLQALFDLNALTSLKVNIFVVNIPGWRIKRLVATSFAVVNVLSYDSPVFKIEYLFSKNIIGLEESIENKSVKLLAKK